MKSMRLFLATMLALASLPAAANNIQVSNVTIADQDAVTKTANIVFDLSWENSWRLTTGPANWDAAWVFIKYHNGDNVWRHAKLGTLAANHTMPTGAEVSVGMTGSNAVGVFIHRSAEGSGNNAWTGVKLKWNYGADGILDTAIITADVQAIEMVRVPQGAFYVGDGSVPTQNTESLSFRRGDNAALPYQVTSAGQIDIGPTAGEIGGRHGSTLASTSIFPPLFPNGYSAFYCMKYEASVDQVRRAIQTGMPDPGFTSPGGAANQACFDGVMIWWAPYLAWSGLRPMTAFEYEKACRGPVYPVTGEYAWGTAIAANAPYTLADVGLATEHVATGYNPNAGNCTYFRTINGPTRVGMYAKSSYSGGTSARIQSGSGYWGIMDLTGNAAEPVCEPLAATLSTQANYNSDPANHIQVGPNYYAYSATKFRGTHGDGTGNVPVDWHLNENIKYVGAVWDFQGNSSTIAPISQIDPQYPPAAYQSSIQGIRGVRNAP